MAFQRQIMDLLKDKKAVSLKEISTQFNIPASSLNLILADLDSVSIVEGTLLLDGLGQTKCVSCGENADKNDDDAFSYYLSKDDLKNYEVIESKIAKEGVLGHKACFEKLGVYFRLDKSITCESCCSFDFGWEAGDSVEETCFKLNDEHHGHQYLGHQRACNFYAVDSPGAFKNPAVHTKFTRAWGAIEKDVHSKTKENLPHLVQLLENAHLIKKQE